MSESYRNLKVSVIGAARSGIAAARVLHQLGADVLLSDSKPADALDELAREAGATGAHCLFGAAPEAALPPDTRLVVTSPGVPRQAPVLQAALERGIPIWSEIELAYRLSSAPIVATTGTNGKTTTTLLIAAMLASAGRTAVVCGNISADAIKKALVEAVQESSPDDILVAEISSFQLEWVERFGPRVALLTNITPDHLNRHADFEEYAQTKARIFAAQAPDDWAVVGYDDPAAQAIGAQTLPAQRVWFTTGSAPPDDGPAAWVQQDMLTLRLETGRPPITLMPAGDLPPSLPGRHSVANVLAASAAALAMGAAPEAIARAVRGFAGVAHRMEWVADVDGVRYINNSMCTNIAAASCSLEALDRPAVVIAGGADKELDFAPLVPMLQAKAKRLILIGSAADKMEAVFRRGGYEAIDRADTLEAAVNQARQRAVPGDAVLLSPACASFDMFRDFEARGAAFRAAVHRLQENRL